MQQNELPEGWASVILEDQMKIAARIGWKGLKRAEYAESGPLMLAVKDILTNGKIYYEGVSDHLSDFRYEESPEIQLQDNDILVTKDGTIGKIGFVDDLNCKATVNSSILVVRPSSAINPRYLFYYFRSPFFQEIVQSKITGSAVPHIFQKDIKKFQVLIPPLPEQHRIVTAIEALFARLDATNERLDRVPGIMKTFRQAVLAAACDGRLTEDWRSINSDVEDAIILLDKIKSSRKIAVKSTKTDQEESDYEIDINEKQSAIPDTWNLCRVEDIAIVKLGGTPSRKVEAYWGGNICWLSSGEIANCRITSSKETITQEGLQVLLTKDSQLLISVFH